MYYFPITSLTNYHILRALGKNAKLFLTVLEVRSLKKKQTKVLAGLYSSGVFMEQSVLLSFPASKGQLHSLPPSSTFKVNYFSLCFQLSQLFFLPLIFSPLSALAF